LRAFRSRNYRLYFIGQGISLIGTWMQMLAQGWLVYRLTQSPLLLGLVSFASQAPVMILTPLTGVLADRWNRYRMMIAVQVGEMTIALAMALLYFSGLIQIWHIVALGMGMGILNAIDAPNRHAFIVQIVHGSEDLPNAIALNSAMFNSARLVGPSLAGLLIAWAGEGVCFLLNGLSFLAIIASLLAMRLPAHPPRPAKERRILTELVEGFRYTFNSPPHRLIIIHFAWVSLVGMSFMVLMPVLAKEVLHGGADRLGYLMGGMGTGALVSAFIFAARRKTDDLWQLSGYSSLLFGASLLLLSLSRTFFSAFMAMGLAGFGMISQMTTANTYLQMTIADDKRARVMAFYLLAFFGTVPLGNLAMGAIAKALGAPAAIRLGAVLTLAGSLLYFQRFVRLAKVSGVVAQKTVDK